MFQTCFYKMILVFDIRKYLLYSTICLSCICGIVFIFLRFLYKLPINNDLCLAMIFGFFVFMSLFILMKCSSGNTSIFFPSVPAPLSLHFVFFQKTKFYFSKVEDPQIHLDFKVEPTFENQPLTFLKAYLLWADL